jgi:hypothetical protein
MFSLKKSGAGIEITQLFLASLDRLDQGGLAHRSSGVPRYRKTRFVPLFSNDSRGLTRVPVAL